jgi:putative membrane protein
MIATLISAMTSVYAADSSTPAANAASDHSFYAKATAGGMAEVEAGKLAQTKGSSSAVREFGAMMVRDHTTASEKLKQIAARKNVTLPTEPDEKHKAMKRELEAVSGQAFDAAYIKGQIADHEATEALLKQEIESGTDADAKAWATATLPTVSAHLKQARGLSGGASDTSSGHQQ